MPLIVETGAGIANANSYVDIAYADAYFAGHPFYADSWADITSVATKEYLLEMASRDVDLLFNWKGSPATTIQGLRWPRSGAYTVDGVAIPSNVIPTNLKQGVCEHARYLSTSEGNPDAPSDTEGVTELKVDVITLKFGNSEARKAVPTATLRLLAALGSPYSSSRVRKTQVTLG